MKEGLRPDGSLPGCVKETTAAALHALFVWEIGNGIQYWSNAAERLYGFSPHAARGHARHDLLETRLPRRRRSRSN